MVKIDSRVGIERAGGEYILVECLEDLIEEIKKGGEKHYGSWRNGKESRNEAK